MSALTPERSSSPRRRAAAASMKRSRLARDSSSEAAMRL
jgi:hypothetical protein